MYLLACLSVKQIFSHFISTVVREACVHWELVWLRCLKLHLKYTGVKTLHYMEKTVFTNAKRIYGFKITIGKKIQIQIVKWNDLWLENWGKKQERVNWEKFWVKTKIHPNKACIIFPY